MPTERTQQRRTDKTGTASPARLAALVLVALASLLPTTLAASASAPPRLPGHALLVDRPGLRVFGPPLTGRVPCPRLLPLPAGALATVKRAVELAMPPYERTLKLDGRDPIVKVGPAGDSCFSYRAGGCGRSAWGRSIVASVLLPHVEKYSASLSQHTFAVGRVRQGWVLWGYIH